MTSQRTVLARPGAGRTKSALRATASAIPLLLDIRGFRSPSMTRPKTDKKHLIRSRFPQNGTRILRDMRGDRCIAHADSAQDEPAGVFHQRLGLARIGDAASTGKRGDRDHRCDMVAEPELVGRTNPI